MAAATLLFIGLHQLHGVDEFKYDAAVYWKLSQRWTLLNFPKAIRGYFWPAVLSPARYLADIWPQGGLIAFRTVSSIAYAFGLAVLLPTFHVRVFGGRLNFWRRMIVPLLVAGLAPGVVLYPLSDLPAFLLLIGSLTLLIGLAAEPVRPRKLAKLVLAGFLLGAAYNVRTIYLFPLICVVLAVPFLVAGLRGRLAAVAGVLVGLAVVSLPQALINLRHHGVLTPMVYSQVSHSKSLFASQLLWGITVQRYETSIAAPAPAPCINYLDKAGTDLLDRSRIDPVHFGVADYIGLVTRHPFDFLGIYGRHVLNGLDLRDGEVYVDEPGHVRNGASALSFLVMFMAAWLLLMRQRLDPARAQDTTSCAALRSAPAPQHALRAAPFWLFVVLLPVLAIVPGAMETRFFLPLHLLAFGTIAFRWDWSDLNESVRRRSALIAGAFVATGAVYFAVTLTTMSGVSQACMDLLR